MKTLTQSAQAAKAIKQELKQAYPNIKFSVVSDNYSMGDSVRINWTDGPTEKQVSSITDKYQYGSFNGMEDIYETTNRREDLPQSKYVQCSRSRSDETDALIIEQIKKDFDPEFDLNKHYGHCCGSQLIWQRFVDMDLNKKAEVKEETKINGSFVIVDYSDKAIAVFGETKPIKEELKNFGGRFNPFLNNNGTKQAGWIFPKVKRADIEGFLFNSVYDKKEGEPDNIKEIPQSVNKYDLLIKKSEAVKQQADKIDASVKGNWTNRRQSMADSMQHRKDDLYKIAIIIERLASLWKNNEIEDYLKPINSKAAVELFLHGYFPTKPDSSYNNWYAKEYPQKIKYVQSFGVFTDEQFKQIKNRLKELAETEKTPEMIRKEKENEFLKKIHSMNFPGFFPTPKPLIDKMIDLSGISHVDSILEPSAGIGSIAENLTELCDRLDCCELQYTLYDFLEFKGFNMVDRDIMSLTGVKYDAIFMNPPFENREDLKHVMHCYELLNNNGVLVSIISAGSYKHGFETWLNDKDHEIHNVEAGSFKDSFNSTGVGVKIIVINN